VLNEVRVEATFIPPKLDMPSDARARKKTAQVGELVADDDRITFTSGKNGSWLRALLAPGTLAPGRWQTTYVWRYDEVKAVSSQDTSSRWVKSRAAHVELVSGDVVVFVVSPTAAELFTEVVEAHLGT
jgi:hypothetical protein